MGLVGWFRGAFATHLFRLLAEYGVTSRGVVFRSGWQVVALKAYEGG